MSSEFEALFFVKSWIERGAKKSHASSGLKKCSFFLKRRFELFRSASRPPKHEFTLR